MKNYILTILALLVLTLGFFTTGCTTTSSGGGDSATTTNSVITPFRVYKITKLAAYVGAATQAKKPENVASLVQARNGFCALKNESRWDIETAVIIANQNGLGSLTSSEGQIALAAVPILIDSFYNKEIDLRKTEYARAFIEGSCDGLSLALPSTVRSPADGNLILKNLEQEAKATR